MIYKYFKADEYSISNLIRDELYCKNYQSFNDPFECWFILKEGIPDIKKEPERFKNICDAWGYHPGENADGFEDYNNYMEELQNYQPDICGYINGAKISCFSKQADNLLMWSHYGDGLRGFCIEFDEKKILSKSERDFASIIPVRYAKKPPIVDKMIYALANDQIWYNEMPMGEDFERKYKSLYQQGLKEAKFQLNDLYKRTIATKPFEWKYEKEVRLIFYSEADFNKGQFFSYPPEAITSFFVGEKIEPKVKETLFKIIDSKSLSIQKKIARRNSNSFKIEFDII